MANPSGEKLRNTIVEIDAQISYHQSAIHHLLATRATSQLQLDSIVYPILTLPHEITSEIFLSSISSTRGSMDPREAPILFSHVCRTWREIALSTPALWAAMHLNMRTGNDTRRFKIWLSRVRTLPLSLTIHLLDMAQKDIDGFREAFAGCSHGIQALEVWANDQQFRSMEAIDSDRWSFPLLDNLVVRRPYGEDEPNETIRMFGNAPCLRDVALENIFPASITIPWHQLSKFTGKGRPLSTCLYVLRLAPNLREFVFEHWEYEESHIPDLQEITHPNLQSLTFLEGEKYFGGTFDILKRFALPALQTLDLDFASRPPEFEEVLHAFLSRSSPPLQTFVICLGYETDFDTAALLQHDNMRQLVKLEIHNPTAHFIDKFFISFKEGDTSFLPQLQHLTFVDGIVPLQRLLELAQPVLTARWHARERIEFAPLKSIHLQSNAYLAPKLAKEVLRPFMELAAQGIDIRIKANSTSYL